MSGQIFGIIYSITCTSLADKYEKEGKGPDGAKWCFVLLSGACIFATILSLFVKEKLKRIEAEKNLNKQAHDDKIK